MKLLINGEAEEAPNNISVLQLLQHLGLEGPVAVELNREVVPRAEHRERALNEGDVLEIVHFVGGG